MNLKLLNQITDPFWILNFTEFQVWPDGHFVLPKWQAHRGYWVQGAAENSVQAFRQAKGQGYEMCELDVQMTKDLVPVVFHDKDLKRLHNDQRKISECSFDEFKSITGLSSLKEVLLDSSLTPYFNVEIKSAFFANDPLATLVAQVIKETKSENRVLISSFNPWCLAKIKSLLPEVPRALLVTQESARWNMYYLRRMLTAPFVQPHILHLDEKMLNEKTILRLGRSNIPYAVWTVNDEKKAQKFLDLGAKSIITDKCLPHF